MNYISSQFGNPKGILSEFLGVLMAHTNQAKDDWTREMLDIQPDDCIFEIGFGSGAAIQKISQIAEYGFIAGIYRSQVILQQASSRNKQANQPRWAKTEAMLNQSARNTVAQVEAAGFIDIQLEFKSMKSVDCICLQGIK